MRSATGKSARPEYPAIFFAMMGRIVFKFILIPVIVLIRLIPSAPASSAERAMAAMSVTLGDSLT